MLYDLDAHVAELYDRLITDRHDIALIRRLIGSRRELRILEPFCGTGRILIPLARDGHTVVGMDSARAMLDRAAAKLGALSPGIRKRVTLLHRDVLRDKWPGGFDLVILAGNCLYELATSGEQARVIAQAAEVLRTGGYLFLDNDHMEGELDRAWYDPPVCEGVFPTGECADGTRLESRWEVVWYDRSRRLVRFLRRIRIIRPDGSVVVREYVQQKHPVSTVEVADWLTEQGLTLEGMWEDHHGSPYTAAAPRAIFWARKPE